ncbi:MAG: ATP-binding cassette domain-containing protein [Fulvivirga sp.]
MEISLQQLSKRYNKEWIFRDLNYVFKAGNTYALVGANGSGKSTLLQIISGYRLPSSGKIIYSNNGTAVAGEEIYSSVAIAAPYMELIEEFTLLEHLKFHFKFRTLRANCTLNDVMESCYLLGAKDKYIKNFSSGMKQRLKLALALYTQTDLVLLDEPTSNLDAQGVIWYHDQLKELITAKNIVIIASNQAYEYENYCSEMIDLQLYK